MCHPHSVRIDMDHFQAMLESYDDDMATRTERGESTMTYSGWTRAQSRTNNTEQKKKKKRSKEQVNKTQQQEEMSDPTVHHSKSWVVEVVAMSTARGSSNRKGTETRKKRRKQKTKLDNNEDDDETEFRVAKPMTMSRLLLQQPVICWLESEDTNSKIGKNNKNDNKTKKKKNNDRSKQQEYSYFAGTIVDVVDGHYAKIHFRGSKKTDDVWLSMDSGKLFLDAGVAEQQ